MKRRKYPKLFQFYKIIKCLSAILLSNDKKNKCSSSKSGLPAQLNFRAAVKAVEEVYDDI